MTLLLQIWPGLGTWKLNVAKSTHVGSLPHQKMTLTLTAEGQAVRVFREGVNGEGKVIRAEEVMYPDGLERPYEGGRSADTYVSRRLDDYTIVTNWKRAGKVTLTAQTVISADGESMVILMTGTRDGQKIRQVEVFE